MTYSLESDGTYSVSAGTSKTYTTITIPSTYNGKAVTKISAGGFYGYTALRTLTLGSNIKTIKGSNTKGAFEGCTSLSSVTLNSGLQEIGAYAFSGCSSLTRITIPTTVSDIGSNAFNGCGFTSIYIPDSVEVIVDNAFYGCRGLRYITIPNSIRSIGNHAFEGCTNAIFTVASEEMKNYLNSVHQ